MIYINQISMNVMKTMVTVVIIAPTLKEALNVLVLMAINQIVIEVIVQVSYICVNQSNDKSCSDINECDEGIDGCDHNCTNTEGSFECTCDIGYKLDSNSSTCLGKYSTI